MQNEDKPTDRSALEYQTAQDSAQFHDQLAWTTTGIVWGASLLLLGFVLQGFREEKVRLVLTAIAALGAILIGVVWHFQNVWRGVKNRKYQACQRLEQLPGFEQKHHTCERHNYPRGSMSRLYGLISIAFILVWLFIIAALWWPALR